MVRNVALSRVWEDGKDGRDFGGRGSFAGGDGDEKLNEMIVDGPAA